ncbi:MAG: glycosyltransferase family 4 protein [Devosia sp.]
MKSSSGRILMSLDAVGGVWRYAMDLARTLRSEGFTFVFAGLGPKPNREQISEAEDIGDLVWLDQPLDWLVADEAELDDVGVILAALAEDAEADLLHLNLPSQAARLPTARPVLVVSHSCVVTWFRAVQGIEPPLGWLWQKKANAAGFSAADCVVVPSQSHAEALRAAYGPVPKLAVVANASAVSPVIAATREPRVLAAGRLWDTGKNAALLPEIARHSPWPIAAAGAKRGPNGEAVDLPGIAILGEVSHRELMGLMAQAAIFLSPARYEPFGLAPLEAARQGAALVLSDIPTHRELWSEAALLVDPDDAEAFGQAIGSLVADASLRADLAHQAQMRSMAFTPLRQGKAMACLYRELIAPQAAHIDRPRALAG